jgi:phytanoyl-CoA hydroxylase
MWMMPGSHRWGNCLEYLGTQYQKHVDGKLDFFQIADDGLFKPPADAPIRQIKPVPWPIKKGEVSFHHSLTWHGSPANKSPRPRPAIAVHYMTGEARFVKGAGHLMEQFINLPDGAPMAEAGEHFPTVCRNGVPSGVPGKLRSLVTG